MRLGVMVSGEYLCIRANKITRAMNEAGWVHDAICRRAPSHFPEVYRKCDNDTFRDRQDFYRLIQESPAEIIHVHNEPNWTVSVAKEASNGRPVVMNVHDVTSGRPGSPFDPDEEQAYRDADAFVFVSQHQHDYAVSLGLDIGTKPYALLPNYAPSIMVVKKPLFESLGGVAYVGGIEPRGRENSWRDMSPVADALDGQLDIYPGNSGIDYGIVHETEYDVAILAQRLARHDWGFCGVPVPNPAWSVSLPNKFYEYLAAGLPVLTFNTPAVAEVVNKYGIGLNLRTLGDLKDLSKLSKIDRKIMVKNVKAIREEFTMERNIHVITDLYEVVLRGGDA